MSETKYHKGGSIPIPLDVPIEKCPPGRAMNAYEPNVNSQYKWSWTELDDCERLTGKKSRHKFKRVPYWNKRYKS